MVSGVEWLFAWPGSGIEDDSCCLFNSFGLACVGPLESPLPVIAPDEAGGICASGRGAVFSGAAMEPLVPPRVGAGGVSAFLQPINNVARKAETKTERVKDISTSYGVGWSSHCSNRIAKR